MEERYAGNEEHGLPALAWASGLALAGALAFTFVRRSKAGAEEPQTKPKKRRARPKRVNPPISRIIGESAGPLEETSAGVSVRPMGPVELRPYQRQAANAVFDAWRKGRRRVWITLASGLGKTVIFAEVVRRLRLEGEQRPVLVLAHRAELLDQARQKLRSACPSARIGIERGNQHADEEAEIILASIQTLGREGCQRASWLERRGPALIIVDECHHATASSYRNILSRFGAFALRRTPVLGCTATPERLDGIPLDEVFEAEVFHYPLEQGIADRWLVPVLAWRVEGCADLSRVRTTRGDWAVKELSRAVNVPERTRKAWEALIEWGQDQRTLVFCCDVQHARDVAALFRTMGTRAAALDGAMSRQERAEVINAFRSGALPVLVNCEVATEGFDVPEVSCILMLRPTQSPALYEQMIGRGSRRSPCKPHLRVIDLVDKRADDQVTAPELFGLPPSFDAEKQSVNYCARLWRAMLARGWNGPLPNRHRDLERMLRG